MYGPLAGMPFKSEPKEKLKIKPGKDKTISLPDLSTVKARTDVKPDEQKAIKVNYPKMRTIFSHQNFN